MDRRRHRAAKSLRASVGEIEELEWVRSVDYSDEIVERVRSVATPQLTEVMGIADKAEREGRQDEVTAEIRAQLEEEFSETADAAKQIGAAVRSVTKEIVRRRIVEDGFRIDGRATDEVRPLSAEVAYVGETGSRFGSISARRNTSVKCHNIRYESHGTTHRHAQPE